MFVPLPYHKYKKKEILSWCLFRFIHLFFTIQNQIKLHHQILPIYFIFMFNRAISMESRAVKYKVLLADRARIVWMWLSGMSVREISQESGTSVSTVYRWIRRWQKEGSLERRSPPGRPYSISRERYAALARTAQSSPRAATIHSPASLQLSCNTQKAECFMPKGTVPGLIPFHCRYFPKYTMEKMQHHPKIYNNHEYI